jgi:hypothetical protein
MPIRDAPIVGLGVRQAEFGLVEKQKRGLLGLKTIGLEGLATVIRALALTAPLGRKNAALLAAPGQEEFPAQRSWICSQRNTSFERRPASGRRSMKSARSSLWRRRLYDAKVRPKHICSFVMAFKQHRNAP